MSDALPYKVVWVASAPRTGSMWAYHVTRQLLAAGGYKVVAPPVSIPEQHWPDFARRVINDGAHGTICCIKFHHFLRLDIPKTKFIVTYRDVRDSVLSFMRFMHVEFDNALETANTMMKLTDHYFKAPDHVALKIRYSDIIDNATDTVVKISKFLSIDVSKADATSLANTVTRDRVKALITTHDQSIRARIAAGEFPPTGTAIRNPDGTMRFIELNTGFQSGHITSSRDGEWREALSKDQQDRLHSATADWLLRYGFLIDQ